MPTDSTAQRLLPHLRRAALARDRQTPDGQLLGAFVTARDEAAFEALVRRHGPMVLGVCRRVIGDPHLAEDAFQATFLVLARRAPAVRPRHLVGPWLYGVAYRTALKARGSALRRRAKEKQVDAMPHPPVSPEEAWADLQPVLDAELARLPDKYRVPVVLCDLHGRPQRDVARELGLPPATLANRLAAARRLLARRLTARGVALSGGAVAAALGWHAATSAVPPALVHSTVKAACAAAAGTPVGLPVPVVELSEGVMRMFVLSKLRAMAAGVASCLVLLAGLGLVAGSTLRANPDEKPAPLPAPAAKAAPQADPKAAESEDAKFLRRTSLDLRGTLPTGIEMHYFLADRDPNKRGKVTDWMLPEHGAQKVTAACQKCHVASAPFLHQPPYFHGLFDHPDGHPGIDAEVAALWRVQTTGPAPDQDVLNAKATLARMRAEEVVAGGTVKVAETELGRVRAKVARKEATPAELDAAEANLQQAKTGLGLAKANVQAAETALALAELAHRTALGKQRTDQAAADQERVAKDNDEQLRSHYLRLRLLTEQSDVEFLRRLSQDVRGAPPTRVEENYFQADTDPNKREKLMQLLLAEVRKAPGHGKLLGELLADPEVQKRWAALWRDRLAAEKAAQKRAIAGWTKEAPSDRLDRLLGELLAGRKSDEQILDALCLATLARFPTETERKLILDGLRGQSDKRAAWGAVLKALATTQEAKAHADGLSKRVAK